MDRLRGDEMSKIKIRVKAACLLTDGITSIIDVSHSQIEKGKGVVIVKAEDTSFLREQVERRPELELVGEVEEKPEPVFEPEPVIEPEPVKKAKRLKSDEVVK